MPTEAGWPLFPLDPAAAVSVAPALTRGALACQGGSAAVFAAAAVLRRATAALQAALQDEAGAEARAVHTEQIFRGASNQLARAAAEAVARCGAAPDDPNRIRAVRVLQEGLQAWLDPYAAEAAGRETRTAWAQSLEALPPALAPVLDPVREAMDRAGRQGEAWDAALDARAAAIVARDHAWQTWRRGLQDLVAAAGPGAWLDPVHVARSSHSPEDDWFLSEE